MMVRCMTKVQTEHKMYRDDRCRDAAEDSKGLHLEDAPTSLISYLTMLFHFGELQTGVLQHILYPVVSMKLSRKIDSLHLL